MNNYQVLGNASKQPVDITKPVKPVDIIPPLEVTKIVGEGHFGVQNSRYMTAYLLNSGEETQYVDYLNCVFEMNHKFHKGGTDTMNPIIQVTKKNEHYAIKPGEEKPCVPFLAKNVKIIRNFSSHGEPVRGNFKFQTSWECVPTGR